MDACIKIASHPTRLSLLLYGDVLAFKECFSHYMYDEIFRFKDIPTKQAPEAGGCTTGDEGHGGHRGKRGHRHPVQKITK